MGLVWVERCWVDHRLRTVVIGGDEIKHDTLIGKDLEKLRQRREVPSSLKKIVSFCYYFAYDMLTECVYFYNLIQNMGIGCSWKHTAFIFLFLRKLKWRQWTC